MCKVDSATCSKQFTRRKLDKIERKKHRIICIHDKGCTVYMIKLNGLAWLGLVRFGLLEK